MWRCLYVLRLGQSVESPGSADELVKLGILQEYVTCIQVEAQKLSEVNFAVVVLVKQWDKLCPNFVSLLRACAEAHALFYIKFRYQLLNVDRIILDNSAVNFPHNSISLSRKFTSYGCNEFRDRNETFVVLVKVFENSLKFRWSQTVSILFQNPLKLVSV